jgi:short subunit dehydrogenase-like uncharacterized protein
MTVLIYGSNGYTGQLIVSQALAAGLRPILGGRSEGPVREQAVRLGLTYRVFSLDDRTAVNEGLTGVAVVMHCAGPFSRTSAPMTDACLRTGTHYL